MGEVEWRRHLSKSIYPSIRSKLWYLCVCSRWTSFHNAHFRWSAFVFLRIVPPAAHAHTHNDWMWSSAASPSNLVTFCNFFRLQWNDNEIKRKLSCYTHSYSHSHTHEGEWYFAFFMRPRIIRGFVVVAGWPLYAQIQWIICCFALYYNNYTLFLRYNSVLPFLFQLVNHACMCVNVIVPSCKS